jgi:hypothetical protein
MSGPTLAGLAIAFAAFFIVFRVVEFLRRPDGRLPVLRRGLLTDIGYWLFTPYVTRTITTISVVAVAIPVILLAFGRIDFERLQHGFGPAWAAALGAGRRDPADQMALAFLRPSSNRSRGSDMANGSRIAPAR